jgi:hypothetical protein
MRIAGRACALAFLSLLLAPQPSLLAAGGLSVDARFDLTEDGIVDAADWAKMDKDARKAYAYASLQDLGGDPYAMLKGEQTRGERFLKGLNSVYK